MPILFLLCNVRVNFFYVSSKGELNSIKQVFVDRNTTGLLGLVLYQGIHLIKEKESRKK